MDSTLVLLDRIYRGTSLAALALFLSACTAGQVTVQYRTGSAAKLGFSGLSSVTAGDCVPYRLKTLGANGRGSKDSQELVLHLTGWGSGAFYSDDSCLHSISQVTLPPGHNLVEVYFKGLAQENIHFTATLDGIDEVAMDIPVKVESLSLSLGASHSCAVLFGGSAWCWGNHTTHQIGSVGGSTLAPAPVAVLDRDVLQVASGAAHSCALLRSGHLKCWGDNTFGQLGDGSNIAKAAPVDVLSISTAVGIWAGAYYSCALLGDQSLRCWGDNRQGQLGDGTFSTRNTPLAVSGMSSVLALSLGDSHACAIVSGKTLKCWGFNSSGQLGDNTVVRKNTPIDVPGLGQLSSVAAGGAHTCVGLQNDTVKCWGENSSGQLGDGTTITKHVPTAVATLSGVALVAAGESHTCALLSGGPVQCWGANASGQLGDGTTSPRIVPTLVPALNQAVQIATGGSHTCVLLSQGKIQCWGLNDSGQLGDFTVAERHQPVDALFYLNALAIDVVATYAGTCQKVQISNTLVGAAAPFAVDLTLHLSSSLGAFYSDDACTKPVSLTTVKHGQLAAVVYYNNPTPLQNSAIAVSAEEFLASQSSLHTFGTHSGYTITGADDMTAGSCQSFTLHAVDADSSGIFDVPVSTSKVVSLYSRNTDGFSSGTFYTNTACTQVISDVTLAPAASTQTFYYKNTSLLELVDLSADSDGGSLGYSPLLPQWPIYFGHAVDVGQGGQYQAQLTAVDDLSTTACTLYTATFSPLPDNRDFTLCGNDSLQCIGTSYGNFFSDSFCSVPITDVPVLSGQNNFTFYYSHNVEVVPFYVIIYDAKDPKFYAQKTIQ